MSFFADLQFNSHRYLLSPLFTFTVGVEQKQVPVHSAALAELSPSLNALINGEMIEAKTKHADWTDVDEATFIRLCEFAYFRNYTPPSPHGVSGHLTFTTKSGGKRKKPLDKRGRYKQRHSEESWDIPPAEAVPEPEGPTAESAEEPADPVPAEPVPAEPEPAEPGPASEPNDLEIAYKERSVWTGQLCDIFNASSVIVSAQDDSLDRTFMPPVNSGPWEDFTPVFLEQVSLYVLADKYCIDSLRHLVIRKLHQTLESFKLYDSGVSSIIEFVRFVYANTPPSYSNQRDALRNLAARYVASLLGQIGDNEHFQNLLEEGGPFVSDLWQIIWSPK